MSTLLYSYDIAWDGGGEGKDKIYFYNFMFVNKYVYFQFVKKLETMSH
jgi:hypothetical protein